MKTKLMSCAFLIAILFLLVSCGGGGTSDCTPNGKLWVLDNGGNPLHAVSFTTSQYVFKPDVQVFVGYTPQVAAIAAGYPPGAVDPRSLGIDIVEGPSIDNPVTFSVSFDANRAPGTYNATWRFVAADAGENILGCQDLPVTFTIN